MQKEYPHIASIRNLVFEGGGVKGIAYLGALDRLYQTIKPSAIQGAGGTSAGAITALVVSFGLDAKTSIAITIYLDFAKMQQRPTAADFPHLSWEEKDVFDGISHLFGGDIWSLYALFHDYGWFSSEYFYSWLKKQIGLQLGTDGTETFAQYKASMEKKLGRYIDLKVHSTNLSTTITEVLSYATTPDLEVASAIRMSMSIPLFFNAINYNQNLYCDGGVIANYPMGLFGDDSSKHFETLGFHLFTPEKSCPASDSPKDTPPALKKDCGEKTPISGIESYIKALFSALLVPASEVRAGDIDRTVEISNYCVETTDFEIKPDTPDYNGLFNSGYNAVDQFLTNYQA